MSQVASFKEIAETAGAQLIAVAGLPGHCLYVKGTAAGYFSNDSIEAMTVQAWRQLVKERTQPKKARPVDPEVLAAERRARQPRRSPVTGRFDRMERVR